MKHIKINCRKRRSIHVFKSSFILLVVLLFNAASIGAQVPKELPSTKMGTVNAGSLLTQFTNAIKPTSFTDQWANGKSSWLSSASKIATAPGMIENISSLSKFIKPSMFRSGFSAQSLLQTATKAKSMADAAGLLKKLEGGLKPEAMVSGWSGERNTWLSALNLLK